MDASLVKSFTVTERFRFALRMDSFNVLNNMTWADPSTNVYSSTFGQSTDILANTYGRRTQLGLRVEFLGRRGHSGAHSLSPDGLCYAYASPCPTEFMPDPGFLRVFPGR